MQTYPTAEQQSIRVAAGALSAERVAGIGDHLTPWHQGWIAAPTEERLRGLVAHLADLLRLRDGSLAVMRHIGRGDPRHDRYQAEWQALAVAIEAMTATLHLFLGGDALALMMRDARVLAERDAPIVEDILDGGA